MGLKNSEMPMTEHQILKNLSDALGIRQKFLKESVQKTLRSGVRHGYIQREGRKYFVELSALKVFETLREATTPSDDDDDDNDDERDEKNQRHSHKKSNASSKKSVPKRNARSCRTSKAETKKCSNRYCDEDDDDEDDDDYGNNEDDNDDDVSSQSSEEMPAKRGKAADRYRERSRSPRRRRPCHDAQGRSVRTSKK